MHDLHIVVLYSVCHSVSCVCVVLCMSLSCVCVVLCMMLCHCSFACGRRSIFYVCVVTLDVIKRCVRESKKRYQRPLADTIQKKKDEEKNRNIWLWLVCCCLLPACYFHQPLTPPEEERFDTWMQATVLSFICCTKQVTKITQHCIEDVHNRTKC